jgi:hypothetical protein
MQGHADDDRRRFRRSWAWGTATSWLGGFLLGFVVASFFGQFLAHGPWQSVLGYFIFGTVLGATVGFSQWLVLRKRVPGIGSWILASAAGMGLAGGGGYGAAVLLFGYSKGLEDLASFPALLGWTAVVAVGGALIGFLQQRVLRGRVARAGRWVLTSTVGWGLSMAAAGAVIVTGFELAGGSYPGPLWFFGFLVVGGVTLGAFTVGAAEKLVDGRPDPSVRQS